jgi:hypothetical protein
MAEGLKGPPGFPDEAQTNEKFGVISIRAVSAARAEAVWRPQKRSSAGKSHLLCFARPYLIGIPPSTP